MSENEFSRVYLPFKKYTKREAEDIKEKAHTRAVCRGISIGKQK